MEIRCVSGARQSSGKRAYFPSGNGSAVVADASSDPHIVQILCGIFKSFCSLPVVCGCEFVGPKKWTRRLQSFQFINLMSRWFNVFPSFVCTNIRMGQRTYLLIPAMTGAILSSVTHAEDVNQNIFILHLQTLDNELLLELLLAILLLLLLVPCLCWRRARASAIGLLVWTWLRPQIPFAEKQMKNI